MTLLIVIDDKINIGSGDGLVLDITWTSIDKDLQRHMASLGPNEFKSSDPCNHILNGQLVGALVIVWMPYNQLTKSKSYG